MRRLEMWRVGDGRGFGRTSFVGRVCVGSSDGSVNLGITNGVLIK